MKRIISLILVFVICLGCVGCGSSTDSNTTGKEQEPAFEVSKDVQMYAPGTTLKTDFGSITVMDAAFCEKAQIYYTKNSTSSKTTINGQTTESYEETIYPGYISVMDNKMIFALKTVMTNNSGKDIEIHNFEAKAFFSESNAVYFSKGGNYDISDEAYNVLPDGESGEYILAALLPVEQYQNAKGCVLEVGGAELGFTYDSINTYNALGFQPEDNASVGIDKIIQTVTNGASSAIESNSTVETEPIATEVKYYREASELPTVDSVTGLELSHSASDSYNGKITRMRYYYDAPKGVKNAPEMIDQYLAYLKDNGYTVSEDGINVEISLNGNPLASIVIMGTMMEVGIDIVQKNTDVPATMNFAEPVLLAEDKNVKLEVIDFYQDIWDPINKPSYTRAHITIRFHNKVNYEMIISPEDFYIGNERVKCVQSDGTPRLLSGKTGDYSFHIKHDSDEPLDSLEDLYQLNGRFEVFRYEYEDNTLYDGYYLPISVSEAFS